MKVAFLTQWFPPEKGSAALPGVITAALQARGLAVRVVTAFPNYPEGQLQTGWAQRWRHREDRDGVEVLRTPVFISHNERPLPRMLNYVTYALSATITLLRDSGDVDTVWVHGTPATAALPAMILKKLRGTPFVLHIQDLWPDTVLASGMLPPAVDALVRRPLEWFCRLSYRQASVIGVITPGMRSALVDRRVPDDKILDIPNWADESIFVPGADGRSTRAEFGLPSSFTVMYAGAVGEVQGLETLVRAAEVLRDREDIHVAIVGDGVAKAPLRRLVDDLGLRNVTFVPSQPLDRMSAVLAAADAQVISLKDLPLYRITLPSKVQATMAAGRPIIVSAGGDAGKVVRDAGAGLSVAPGDSAALAVAISRAADSSADELKAWGEAARAYYDAHFSQALGAAKMVTALEHADHRRKVLS